MTAIDHKATYKKGHREMSQEEYKKNDGVILSDLLNKLEGKPINNIKSYSEKDYKIDNRIIPHHTLSHDPKTLYDATPMSEPRLQKVFSEFWIKGCKVEELFRNTMISNGFEVKKSTDEEDIFSHIDFYIRNGMGLFSVDVKSKRVISEHESPEAEDWVYIEFKNVKGDRGWINGDAHLIAFERTDHFIIAERSRVLNLCKYKCEENHSKGMSFPQYARDSRYQYYTRSGRNDLICLAHIDDIKSCNSMVFMKP